MNKRIVLTLSTIAVAQAIPSLSSGYDAQPFDCKDGSDEIRFDVTEMETDRKRCANFDPCRQPLFGVTHLHTGLSFDASVRFVDAKEGNNPDGAYKFARGEQPITLPNIIGIQGITAPGFNLPPDLRMPTIGQPIDWGGVTDHSEHFGEMGICKDFLEPNPPEYPNPPGRFSLDCRMINGFYWQPFGGDIDSPFTAPFNQLQRTLASNAFTQLTMMNLGPVSMMTNMPVCINNPDECDAAELAVWEEHQTAAEDNYDRTEACEFTTFNAYEVTSTPLGTNWHRNVFFRNDKVVAQPVTAIDMGVVPNENPTSDGPDGVGEPPSYVGSVVPPDVIPSDPQFVTFPLPERLWNMLERDCTFEENVTPGGLAEYCDFLTIPHNSNLGGGVGCTDNTTDDGDCVVPPQWFTPFNKLDAERRAKYEPLVEIYQNKGSSECRFDPRFNRGVDTKDELCNFELLDGTGLTSASGVGTTGGSGDAVPPEDFNRRAFVRNVWKDGLQLAEEEFDGVNPFKMGVVASSDSHTGTMGFHPEDNRWPGHLGIDDAVPVQRPSTIQNSSGGHSVVWAEENSRDSIFEALKRKETYGTSGTRIALRFFGGWSFPKNACSNDFVRMGYRDGVPMGGDLTSRPPKAAPRFVAYAAWDDQIQTPLEQIQIIKGWYDGNQKHEKVIHVAGKKKPFQFKQDWYDWDVKLDKFERVAGGNWNPFKPDEYWSTKSCDVDPNKGAQVLCGVWEDPDFDPNERAFYYARVIEQPVCRYSTLWCQKAFGLNPLNPRQCNRDLEALQNGGTLDKLKAEYAASCCSNETTAPIVQTKIQERAWSSPIWYSPAE